MDTLDATDPWYPVRQWTIRSISPFPTFYTIQTLYNDAKFETERARYGASFVSYLEKSYREISKAHCTWKNINPSIFTGDETIAQSCMIRWYCMMTSLNGNVSALLALCGGDSRKGQWRGALMFSLICAWATHVIHHGSIRPTIRVSDSKTLAFCHSCNNNTNQIYITATPYLSNFMPHHR